MKSTTIVTVVLVALMVLSTAQAFQLNSLKDKMSKGDLSISKTTNTNTKSTPSASDNNAPQALPASIQDLPQMVGGC